MARSAKRNMRQLIIPATGTLSAALITIDLVFMVKDAQSTHLALSSFRGSAESAAILNAAALGATVVLAVTRTLNLQPRRYLQSIPGWIGGLIALASTIITINVLVLKKINPRLVDDANHSIGISTDVEITVWALATVAQLLFYAAFAFAAPLNTASRERRESNASPLATLEKKRGLPDRPVPPESMLFPAPQLEVDPASNKRASWRDSLASLQQIVRQAPPPQQRRLLQQSIDSTNYTTRSSMSREDPQQSINSRSTTPDAFAWDFSAPAMQTRDTITQTAPPRKGGLLPINGTMLPTIPGSRPTSQGQVLDEPFEMVRSGIISFASDKTKDSFDVNRPASEASVDKFSLERVRDLSDRPISTLSTTSTITLPDNFPPRPDTSLSNSTPEESRPPTVVSTTATSPTAATFPSRPSTTFSTHSATQRPVLTSRPTTPSIHEAHIHPLFRADSPVPPPAVSANTTITASTFSGQTIGQVIATPPAAHRSASPWASDAFTVMSSPTQSRSQSRSASRQRNGAVSPPLRETQNEPSTPKQAGPSHVGSNESSPQGTPKRGMAIPDFILSANNERLK